MKISEVTTSKKIGSIIKKDDDSPNKIKVVWVNPKDNILTDNRGRVYLLVINGVICKIGGSQSKGGIKNTIQSYTNCMKGTPSDRSYIIHRLLREELDLGNEIHIYMITAEPVKAPIPGLFGITKGFVSAFKEMETNCIKDYYQHVGEYPKWNFQESNNRYPKELSEEYGQFKANKTKNTNQ
jgi:hypothetical protein